MTNSRPATRPAPRPSEGGSYIRQPDGSLLRADQAAVVDATEPLAEPDKPARKTGVKPPVKEA